MFSSYCHRWKVAVACDSFAFPLFLGYYLFNIPSVCVCTLYTLYGYKFARGMSVSVSCRYVVPYELIIIFSPTNVVHLAPGLL